MSAPSRLQRAVLKLLAPLVRLLLRHGIGHGEFSDWAKQAYVDEAARNFGVPGRKTSVSRIAIVTGINRKEVKRVLERDRDGEAASSMMRHNRAMRVTHGWLHDERFTDRGGQPLALHYGDNDASFNQLVKAHGGDVPARALLDELEASGTVSRDGDIIRLIGEGYVPRRSEDAMIDLFGISAEDLLSTLEHNLTQPEQARLQMTVAYDNVSETAAAAFRQGANLEAMTLLKKLDVELAALDRDHPDYGGNDADRNDPSRVRVGLGIYLIENVVEPSNE